MGMIKKICKWLFVVGVSYLIGKGCDGCSGDARELAKENYNFEKQYSSTLYDSGNAKLKDYEMR